MKFYKEITSLVLVGLSVVVTVVAAITFGLLDSTTLSALGAPSTHGFEPLQATADNAMAILGLALGAGLALGLAGIGYGRHRSKKNA